MIISKKKISRMDNRIFFSMITPLNTLCFRLPALLLLTFQAAAQTNPPNNEKEFEQQYKDRINKERLNGVYIPKNLDDALVQLDQLTSPEAKAKMKAVPEDSVCRYLHGRLGQWMIINWSFYEGSRLSHYLRSAGISYPDDMADFLILAYHKRLNGAPVVVKDLATYLKEKRKKALEEERKNMPVLHEETRKKD
jgi:hypothetical protein